MKNGICPKCNKEEVFISIQDTHGIHIPMGLNEVFTELYVCGNCGFIETYIQYKSDLEKISGKFKKVVKK